MQRDDYELTSDELLPDNEEADYELGVVQDEEEYPRPKVDLYSRTLRSLKILYCGKEITI